MERGARYPFIGWRKDGGMREACEAAENVRGDWCGWEGGGGVVMMERMIEMDR